MKAIVQRVLSARVEVEGEICGQIEQGLVVFVGVTGEDEIGNGQKLAQKLAKLRIFSDEEGRFNHSVQDIGGKILLISNFTLCGDARKGNRPNFMAAAPPEKAEHLYLELAKLLENAGLEVATGRFGADMRVFVENDGPVSIILEQ
jgi:D-tyrosyl-tRNA(Tyr) deacylase